MTPTTAAAMSEQRCHDAAEIESLKEQLAEARAEVARLTRKEER